MDAYEYKQVILEEVRARARGDARLMAEGDTAADYQEVYAHYRRVVDGIVSRYDRTGTAAMALIDEMTETYCRSFRDAMERAQAHYGEDLCQQEA